VRSARNRSRRLLGLALELVVGRPDLERRPQDTALEPFRAARGALAVDAGRSAARAAPDEDRRARRGVL
jgi:hypothetical protein